MNKFQRNNSVRGLVEWISGKIYGFRALMVFDNWSSLLLQRLFLRDYPAFYRKGGVIFWLIIRGAIRQGFVRALRLMCTRVFSLSLSCEFLLIEIHPHPKLSTDALITRIKEFSFELIADGSPD